jgi:hypothetical protein
MHLIDHLPQNDLIHDMNHIHWTISKVKMDLKNAHTSETSIKGVENQITKISKKLNHGTN